MARRSFVTNLPDQSGTFLRAARVIASRNGNIVRVSYNKAVDLHMLFLDVEAPESVLYDIERDLYAIGYINDRIIEKKVIEVCVKIPDEPGAMMPVLTILDEYAINISYMNSFSTGEPHQNFKFGLLIEDPGIVKTLLDDISKVYPVDIIECDTLEENLDNTVFYIRLANEMKDLLGLNTDQTLRFLSESNRVLQVLQSEGENAGKVFEYIRRLAHFISDYRGERFKVSIQKTLIGPVTLLSIQPYCGSNTYLLLYEQEVVIVDTGFAIYAKEMQELFERLVPDFAARPKRVYITHADVDHCGLLAVLENAKIIVNRKSAENFQKQWGGLPDYREQTALHLGYSKISQIISDYAPPDLNRLMILDSDTPNEHEDLLQIGSMRVGPLAFCILEGSGGHLYGEMVLACMEGGIVFTGDILVNITGFTKERAEFNSLAPYLMKSVNVNPKRASEMRRQVLELVGRISDRNGHPCLICGGHGPVSELQEGRMASIDSWIES